MQPSRVPGWAWPPSLLASATALLLAVEMPGDLAYWVSLPLTVPLAVCLAEWLTPWDQVPHPRRVLATAGAVVSALPIWPLMILSPDTRSWLIAALLVLPLGIVIYARFEDDDNQSSSGPVLSGPEGPPGN